MFGDEQAKEEGLKETAMSNLLFKTAASLCVLVLLAHELLGAPMVLPPLSEAGVDEEVILLHHFSWHVGSVSVIAMAVMFFLASQRSQNHVLAVIAAGMSAGFCLLAFGLAVFVSGAMWGTPAPYFWSLIAILGGAGVVSSKSHNGPKLGGK